MEDVLELYAAPLDPSCPGVCLDETPYQLVQDPYPPEPSAPGMVNWRFGLAEARQKLRRLYPKLDDA